MRNTCDAPQLDGRVEGGVDVRRGDTWTRGWGAQTRERGRAEVHGRARGRGGVQAAWDFQ